MMMFDMINIIQIVVVPGDICTMGSSYRGARRVKKKRVPDLQRFQFIFDFFNFHLIGINRSNLLATRKSTPMKTIKQFLFIRPAGQREPLLLPQSEKDINF